MSNICPYCGCEMDYLEVGKDEIIWDGESWQKDDKAVRAIRCPECSDELDTSDLALLGVPVEIIEGGKSND